MQLFNRHSLIRVKRVQGAGKLDRRRTATPGEEAGRKPAPLMSPCGLAGMSSQASFACRRLRPRRARWAAAPRAMLRTAPGPHPSRITAHRTGYPTQGFDRPHLQHLHPLGSIAAGSTRLSTSLGDDPYCDRRMDVVLGRREKRPFGVLHTRSPLAGWARLGPTGEAATGLPSARSPLIGDFRGDTAPCARGGGTLADP